MKHGSLRQYFGKPSSTLRHLTSNSFSASVLTSPAVGRYHLLGVVSFLVLPCLGVCGVRPWASCAWDEGSGTGPAGPGHAPFSLSEAAFGDAQALPFPQPSHGPCERSVTADAE